MTPGRLRRGSAVALAYAAAGAVSLVFVFPYWWMLLGAFRSTEAIMTAPLALWPERIDFGAFATIGRIAGVELWRLALNSLGITLASSAVAVTVTALGAYAVTRLRRDPAMRAVRWGFLVSIMYPYMLLVIPVYVVMHKLGLLGGYAGIVLFLALGPIQFFLFEQFFRSIPPEVIESATIDGAGEAQILWRIVLPMAAPVVATVGVITFLLNWAQWFPVLVISRDPDTFTLPVALLTLNGELGVNFQGIMALAVVTTVPATIVFLLAQRRVMQGMAEGAVKG
ncbi:MAG: carbohydrate ABC transporter permease [Alphaproteobacteria bacterium]|nr:carbohydrate ABC transporter permease [Alphaproteobacteria bacterium]